MRGCSRNKPENTHIIQQKNPAQYCAGFFVNLFLLYSEQNFSIFPEFFEQIEIALVWREEVEDDIAKVHNDPAVAGEALLFAFFCMFGADVFDNGFGERVDHTVAGAGTNDEIIGK